MNLEESDKFVERQRKTEQKKKVVLISIVLCAILVALLVIMIIYLQYQDSLKLKVYVDGTQVKITSNMFKTEDNTNYVNVKVFSELLGYTYTKGEYKKYNEDEKSCYIRNNLEVVAMTADRDTLVKYIDVNEEAPELTEEGPYGMEMTVQSENGESNIFVLDKPVKYIDNELYVPFDYISDVFNLMVDTSTENRIRLYTLPALFQNAKNVATQLEYTTISGVYENIRALAYGLITVGNNGTFGVIDTNGKEILSVKYENIEFLQNSKEFFIRAENTVGLLDEEGKTIIQPTDYDDISILDEIEQLYLVEKDNKYGVVNRDGEIVLHVDYDSIGISEKDVTDYKLENLKNPNIIFDKCIVVELEGAYGLYDLKGKELLKPVYDGFGCLSEVTGEDSLYMTPKESGVEGLVINFNGLYALYDIKNESVILPAVYTRMYSVTKGGATKYYVEFGNQTLELSEALKSVSTETSAEANESEENENASEDDQPVNEETTGENGDTVVVDE